MRTALEGREGDLNTTKAACAQMDKEIGWVVVLLLLKLLLRYPSSDP